MQKLNIIKKINAIAKPYNNEQGFILAAVILLSLILMVVVTMAIWSSQTESAIVRNNSVMAQEFYNAESGLVGALNNSDMWINNDFMAGPSDTTYAKMRIFADGSAVIYESSPNINTGSAPAGVAEIAEVQIRKVDSYVGNAPVAISGLWAEANKYPNMAFEGPPPAGSGSSATSFKTVYFTLTAKNTGEANTTLQMGIWQLRNN